MQVEHCVRKIHDFKWETEVIEEADRQREGFDSF